MHCVGAKKWFVAPILLSCAAMYGEPYHNEYCSRMNIFHTNESTRGVFFFRKAWAFYKKDNRESQKSKRADLAKDHFSYCSQREKISQYFHWLGPGKCFLIFYRLRPTTNFTGKRKIFPQLPMDFLSRISGLSQPSGLWEFESLGLDLSTYPCFWRKYASMPGHAMAMGCVDARPHANILLTVVPVLYLPQAINLPHVRKTSIIQTLRGKWHDESENFVSTQCRRKYLHLKAGLQLSRLRQNVHNNKSEIDLKLFWNLSIQDWSCFRFSSLRRKPQKGGKK